MTNESGTVSWAIVCWALAMFMAAGLLRAEETPAAEPPAPEASAGRPPNILLIVSEDNGPELGCYGEPSVRTPVHWAGRWRPGRARAEMVRSELVSMIDLMPTFLEAVARLKDEIDACFVGGRPDRGRLSLTYPDYFFDKD